MTEASGRGRGFRAVAPGKATVMQERSDPHPAEYTGDEQAVEDPTRVPSVDEDEREASDDEEEEREAQGEDPTSPERGLDEES
jgi:hypothetical protein